MFGIHGKPYVCLDEWCNVDHLKHLVPDVNYGIGKAHQHIRINFGVENHTKARDHSRSFTYEIEFS